ncbi:MAG: 2-amino-4-hydroxy-6-hydroxymethyldihydropteridine diphosphokinase, partial [Candidatus Hydrogenedentes bacterium]|nr:2-amino-4-hydroxy-6-hydroxymethyldihydropteridine diphosphokinase [Candidatus Hydrogenedentota bacterium]
NVDPEKNIVAALEILRGQVSIEALSIFYRTAAIGRPEQPDYLNGVAKIRTPLEPVALKTTVLRPIEAQLGRQKTADRYAARCIDLDILLWGEAILDNEEQTIPDPDITERPFLGAGLLDLDPDIVLPGDTQPMKTYFSRETLAALKVDRDFPQRLKEQFTP